MNHYDGPAFFRKFYVERKSLGIKAPIFDPNNSERSDWSAPVIRQQERAITTKSAGTSKIDQSKKKKQTVSQLQTERQQQSHPANLVEKTRAFQPQFVPDKAAFYSSQRTEFNRNYQRAITALESNPEDLILLATAQGEDSIAEPEIAISTVTEPAQSTSTTLMVTEQPNNEAATSSSVDSQNENKNENTVDNYQSRAVKLDHSKGLGHSLADILQAERGQADHLSLFERDNVPQMKPASQATTAAGKDSGISTEVTSKTAAAHSEPEPLGKLDQQPETSASASESLEQSDSLSTSTMMTTDDQTVSDEQMGYHFPQLELLKPSVQVDEADLDNWIADQAEKLDDTLQAFNVDGHVVDWTNGPTVTQFQVKLALGVKVSKVTNLNDDLKLALAAKDIRIEAPIPGRSTVGIEIPNPKPHPVMLREILADQHFQTDTVKTEIAMGMNIEGQPVMADLKKMPHALIAGATGSGKSVFINSLLLSLLYHATPRDLRMILIDPKAVELAPYNEIPHLLAPVISQPQEAAAALKWVTEEMDRRYERLTAAGVRNIEQYNRQAQKTDHAADRLPYILVVIDELADLMMTSANEVQDYIVRITQKARAAGIHLVVATQRPSVDIVTGTIKNNIPTRVAFMVSSQVDSRTIIDQAGAERLLGKGDMLYLGNGANKPERLQGAFVTSEEVEKVTDFVRTQGPAHYEFQPAGLLKSANQAATHDELWNSVLEYIAGEENVSTSKLQRVFSIGYNRAASIIDDLEQHNFISGQQGSKPREIYLTKEQYAQLNL
ncbi:DNA translocase FtsK [Fructilactobacillus carniphilus]|uniref:DNA translocase FtsK n=2 Tax=Fructilactobacillus carniphilus TaxID=2940297 RepID=A0ABY5BYE5_9LACO|nr:DNA translocase FtsK [Fructilactobacillus carniphilus]USS91362.1 DNA translocase FtsK [Fructilactobacillus carniphilus]